MADVVGVVLADVADEPLPPAPVVVVEVLDELEQAARASDPATTIRAAHRRAVIIAPIVIGWSGEDERGSCLPIALQNGTARGVPEERCQVPAEAPTATTGAVRGTDPVDPS
jgi:hypothetical protein